MFTKKEKYYKERKEMDDTNFREKIKGSKGFLCKTENYSQEEICFHY